MRKMILFIGMPATGKSSFYRDRFYITHIRINLDMLKNRDREQILVDACFEAKQPFVVDNTNFTVEQRQRYIVPAKKAGFTVIGYFFKSRTEDALRRNAARQGRQRVRDEAIYHISSHLQPPALAEGFDELFVVRLRENSGYRVESATV